MRQKILQIHSLLSTQNILLHNLYVTMLRCLNNISSIKLMNKEFLLF